MNRDKAIGIGITSIILCGLVYMYAYPVVRFHWLKREWKAEIQRKQNPTELQEWAVQLMKLGAATNDRDVLILHDKPPPGIPRSQYGPRVALMEGNHYVQLGWGSGMLGLWGMRIGDTNYSCPDGEVWRPGVYFFSN